MHIRQSLRPFVMYVSGNAVFREGTRGKRPARTQKDPVFDRFPAEWDPSDMVSPRRSQSLLFGPDLDFHVIQGIGDILVTEFGMPPL